MENIYLINSESDSKSMKSLENLQALIDKKIHEFCRNNGESNIQQPVNYILSLGGKRVRPLLTLLAADLFGDNIEDAVYPAIAIEIFHNFTLMHDDIMDNAPLRRGKATVHEKWGRDVAILSGDAMLIQAYQHIIKTKASAIGDVIGIFNRTALEVCEGQQLDMDFQSRPDVTIAEYIEMIRLKTSVLLGGAMEIGASISGAHETDRNLLCKFAINLGLSFQLWDDYLDAFGDAAKTGKQVGGDILADKKTFLMIRAMEKANEDDRTVMLRLQSENTTASEKIETVKKLYMRLGVDQELKSEVERYYHQAMEHLDSIAAPSARKAKIAGLAKALHERQF